MTDAQWGVVILLAITFFIGVNGADIQAVPSHLLGGGVLAIALVWLASEQAGLSLGIAGLILFAVAIHNTSNVTKFINAITGTTSQ